MTTISLNLLFNNCEEYYINIKSFEDLSSTSKGFISFYSNETLQSTWEITCSTDSITFDFCDGFRKKYCYDNTYFLNVKEIVSIDDLSVAPLWDFQFVNDLSNLVSLLSGKNKGIKSIDLICKESNTLGYLGVKLYSLFDWIPNHDDLYVNNRMMFGVYGAEIDPLNINLKNILLNYNQELLNTNQKDFSIKRLAITLLDAGGQFVFANANESQEVKNAAEKMEQSLVEKSAESFTSFLIKNRFSFPISLDCQKQNGQDRFYICYNDKLTEVNNALDKNLVVSVDKQNPLYSLANASNSLKLGLAENFKFIQSIAGDCKNIKLFFYPINYGVSLNFFPAFVLFLIAGSETSTCRNKIELSYLPTIRSLFSAAMTIESISLLSRARRFACKSAIGSIMSRNGSHNIGSHVLAALSHNVGTMPDDRMLYQYIQLRMDYIANVTTDAPSWSQPTMFLGEMMRTFLSQHHLLNHIAESEGLSAWEFQNKNLDSESFQSQERKLKFHIRKIVQSSTNPKYIEIVKYDDPDQKIDFSYDVALAVPAGAAGQHAFFTIIENIVRNSAKHDWSNPPKSTKHLKKVGPEKEVGKTTSSEDKARREIPHGNLEIYIDFEDKAEEGNVEFTIWTNMSDVLDRVVDGNLNSKEALHNKLKDKLKLAFIDESGTLRRENWGLAEMRISAGFLQGRNISEIGGLKQPKKPIIEPVAQLEKIQIENGKTSDVNHLGYRFSVPKPKTILVLVDDITEDEEKLKAINAVFSEWEILADKFKKYGIYAKKYSDVKSKDKLGYEFVVMDDLREENKGWFLPFRVITINPTELEGARELVPLLSKWDSCQALLKQVLECIKDDGTIDKLKLNDNVLNKIFACWCKHIKKRHMSNENDPVNLVLTVKEDNPSGAGQGLISKRDVVKFVFEEAFNSSARSFVELYKLENIEEKVCDKCQKTACDCTKEERETFYAIKELMKPNAKKIIVLDEIHGGSYKSLICSQLFNWYKKLGREDSILIYLKEMNDLKDDSVSAEIEKCQKEIKQYKDKPGTEEKISLLRSRIRSLHGKKDSKHYFGAFIDYLVQVCDQMETVLCKYAENIVSLPKGYGNSDNSSDNPFCEKWKEPEMWIWKGPRKIGGEGTDFTENERELGLYDKSNVIKNNLSIEFVRHSDPNKEPTREERLYLEPLSGSQSSLTLLEKIDFDSKHLITKLVETAFLRILVIDERVAKFLREHKDEVAKTFNCMHIFVADDKKVEDELAKLQVCENNSKLLEVLEKKLEEESRNKPVLDYNDDCLLLPLSSYNIWKGREALDEKDDPKHEDRMKNLIGKFKSGQGKSIFDILIIHQGIIDKWFPGTSNNSKKVDKLLSYLRKLFPYVVITTGRGTPANIPEMARMLPFSTIETTLFRKYPEKMLLVDAVMNLLPKERDNQ